MSRDVQPIPKAGPRPKKRPKPLPWASPKRRAEKDLRAAVRAEVAERDGTCVGPRFGLPGECASPDPRRPLLEVNETHKRSTHPGSHLDASKAVLMCQRHHDLVTSPVGELRELAERVGLIVRSGLAASSPEDQT